MDVRDLPHADSGAAPDGLTDLAALKRSSVRGTAINFAAQIAKFAAQFLYQIAVMKILTPSDFGVVAMAAPLMTFVQMFTDFGLSQAVIQKQHITEKQLSFLFWFGAAVCGALSVLTVALAPLAGWFYGDSRVTSVVMALGGLLFLSGLQSQPVALLNRRMAYVKLAVINLGGLAAGIAAGIATALMGAGFWALVYFQAGMTLSSLVLSWTLCGWRPMRPERGQGVRGLIGFGGNVTGSNMVSFFARNLDNILIGRVWGDAALGLYDRAFKLLLLPLAQVVAPFGSVALPMLSRTLHDPKVYRRAFLRMVEAIVILTYPSQLFALCTSPMLIEAVFGERWRAVAPIFSVLAIGGLFSPIGTATSWLFISQDRTREMRNWSAVSSVIFVSSFVIGLPWGPLGVAISSIGIGVFQGPLIWWATTRRGPVSFRDLMTALQPLMFAGIAALAGVETLQALLPPGIPALVLLFAVSHLTFGVSLLLQPRGRALLAELWSHSRGHLFRAR